MGSMTPGQPNFFVQIMAAYMQGIQQKRERELFDQQESERSEERKLRVDTLKFEQNRIKLEDKLRAATMNREGAMGNLKFMEGINPPQEFLPEGMTGPPRPMGPESMQIPGVTVPESGIDIPGMTAPVRYAPDMQRLMEDQSQRAAAMQAQQAGMSAEATARGQANVAREPRDVPGVGQVPGDLADNFLTLLGQERTQGLQQQFTAGQNDLNRESTRGNAIIGANATRENAQTTRAISQEQNLRAEYDKKIARTDEVIAKIDQAKELAAAPPSGQNDMALVFTFMKALDEGVVRETEYARAASIGSLKERAQASMAKLQNGQLLTPAQRAAYVQTLATIGESVKKQRGVIDQRYSGLAQRKGLDPASILGTQGAGGQTVPEGTIIYDGAGRPHRIVNGQPVPVQ